MRSVCVGVAIAVAALIIANAWSREHAASAAAIRGAARHWSPETSVSLEYFSQPLLPEPWLSPALLDGVVGKSKDGRYFYVLSHRGDIVSDANIYTLRLWNAADVVVGLDRGRATGPQRVVEMRSTSNDPAIRDVRFADAGKSLVFIGIDAKGISNVHRLDIATGRLVQISKHEQPVVSYFYESGTLLITSRNKITPLTPLPYPAAPVERLGQEQLESRKDRAWREWFLGIRLFHVGKDGMKRDITVQPGCASYGRGLSGVGVSISPDGSTAVGVFGQQYGLMNLQNGGCQLIGDYMPPAKGIWSPDGSRILLIALAARIGSGELKIAVYDVSTRITSIIATIAAQRHQTFHADWLGNDRLQFSEIVEGSPVRSSEFGLKDGKWTERPSAEVAKSSRSPLAGGLSVTLRQTINEPPVVIASVGRRSLALTRPDPVFSRKWWAKSRPVQWVEPDGRTVSGGLWLPRDYRLGKRVPLVIQAYHYHPDVFLPDGPHRGTSDAAQSLVARGIAVLQVTMDATPDKNVIGSSREIPNILGKYDAIVQTLSQQGIIDPERVGMTGFSRGGLQVRFVMTHAKRYSLAAGVIVDSWSGTYANMLRRYGLNRKSDNPYGGSFWENKHKWLELEPSFNADKIRTPALITQHQGQSDALFEPGEYRRDVIDDVAMFQMNRKPLEYLVFPKGDHSLQRPREALALQRAVVDWMAFWLKGEVPHDEETAKRWLELRKMQQEVLDGLKAGGETVVSLPPLVPAPDWARPGNYGDTSLNPQTP